MMISKQESYDSLGSPKHVHNQSFAEMNKTMTKHSEMIREEEKDQQSMDLGPLTEDVFALENFINSHQSVYSEIK